MKAIDLRVLCCAAALLLSAQVQAQKAGAHVHGIAELQVAVDGAVLKLEFYSPLHDLVGFEHAPRTEAQKTAVRSMADRLERAGTQFIPAPAAACALASAKLSSPVIAGAAAGTGESAKASPASKTASGAPADQRHDAKDAHAGLSGEFVFRCERPQRLNSLELKLFDSFPRLRRVDVQVAGPRGQSATRLSPKQRIVKW
jgi:hypothetical protein